MRLALWVSSSLSHFNVWPKHHAMLLDVTFGLFCVFCFMWQQRFVVSVFQLAAGVCTCCWRQAVVVGAHCLMKKKRNMYIYVYFKYIYSQTELAMRGSNGVG